MGQDDAVDKTDFTHATRYPALDRPRAVAELQELWRVLNADLEAALAYGRIDDTPYARRALVRAYFALIEGMSYALRQVTVATLRESDLLQPEELLLLREERPAINEQGRATLSQHYLKFPDNLLFSIRMYAKNHGTSFEPDRGGIGWAALRKAVRVRDKVTHPKYAAALHLSDEDLRAFVDGAAWWKATMLAMFAACKEADDYWQAQLGGM